MLCAISGESPQQPVVSTKSGIAHPVPYPSQAHITPYLQFLLTGNIFERRLLESYIRDNGTDPITAEPLTESDILDLKTSTAVKPRPPTLTSIPSLLSVFQNEWDALALETFTLRQHLTQTRQELSNALYENDAAKRVVARLQRERDEARDALSEMGVNGAEGGGGGVNEGEAMQLDGQEMSEELVQKVEATQERLSKTRRKRPVPEDWATNEDLEAFAPVQSTESKCSEVHSIAMDHSEDLALFGGTEGFTSVYSLSKRTFVKQLESKNGAVTGVGWAGSDAITATSTGHVEIWDDTGSRTGDFQEHSGAATALALHPSGEIAASVGADKRIVFYDLAKSTTALKVYTDSALTAAQFHPDGHLFAAGAKDGQIKLYDTKTGANAANFDEGASIEALDFSENGTWLAVVSKNASVVSVWDLRKSNKVKEVDMGGPVSTLKWDYTGQFLAAAGPGGLTIQAYDKGKKEWSEPLRTAVPASALAWGSKGRSLVTVNGEGVVTVLGAK